MDEYIAQDCARNNNCTVATTYGWPMNTWCVGNVTDMTSLFKDKETFNEDISNWDVSNVTTFHHTFGKCDIHFKLPVAILKFGKSLTKYNANNSFTPKTNQLKLEASMETCPVGTQQVLSTWLQCLVAVPRSTAICPIGICRASKTWMPCFKMLLTLTQIFLHGM